MCASQSAVEPLCLAQTSNRYVPPARPPVFQVAFAFALYDWSIDHAPPGGWTQNWYTGLVHPVAFPTRRTSELGACGDTGLGAFHVTAVHTFGICSVYVGLGETCASQSAVEPASLAQTSNRYVPGASPV